MKLNNSNKSLLSFISAVIFVFAAGLGVAEARYASIVVDAKSGRVLHASNPDTRNFPASLTKMMTLYMVFDALKTGKLTLGQKLKVSRRATGMAPSKIGLKRGRTITVEDAVLALITKSANDVAVVAAEAIGGTETKFARMMTKRAREIGMRRTSFRNASGLPNRRQMSTARDMSTLARRLILDFPEYYHYFATRQFKYGGRTFRNHNTLLRDYPGTDGIKTGYTRASGFNLVASAERQGHRLIGVVFGGRSATGRDRHMRKLLERGFRLAPVKMTAREKYKRPTRYTRRSYRSLRPKQVARRVKSTAATAPKRWAIQVGAFSDPKKARMAALNAANWITRRTAFTAVVQRGQGQLYRAQLIGLSERKARDSCRVLRRHKVACMPIAPPGNS